MQGSWAQQEVGQAQLGHAARTKRLVQVVEDLTAHPAESVPQACEDWAATKGAYRFWDNPHVEAAAIRRAQIESTLARCQGQELILAIQDTTDLDYSTHPATRGLGHLQGKRTKGKLPQGLKVHSVLAVSQEGVPLGLLFQQVWVREEETPSEEEKVHRRHRSIEEKESGRWLQAQQAIQEACEPGQRVLTLADREADLYDLFAQPRPVGKELLIRAKHDRRVKTESQAEAGQLWERIRQTPAAVIVAFEVPRTHEHKARSTKLAIRFATLTIAAPRPKKNHAVWKPLPLQVVLAEEVDPPAGETPVSWLLLTTMPVTGYEEAVQVVLWYSFRWLIERYHYALKSGCRIEELQLETMQRLERALATYCIVAWRLLWLTYEAREAPESSCELVLQKEEWQALYATIHQTLILPEQPPTLHEAVGWIARLGGFLGRKSDGEPGVKVIWRGLRRLDDIVATWQLLHPFHLPTPFG
jgi:Transposase DNA-binding/Transposase Tn5 dimerisation domain